MASDDLTPLPEMHDAPGKISVIGTSDPMGESSQHVVDVRLARKSYGLVVPGLQFLADPGVVGPKLVQHRLHRNLVKAPSGKFFPVERE